MAKRKQSKAEREYSRIRKGLLNLRSRKKKQGYDYNFSLPATPKQELWGIRKPRAKDYREAITELLSIKSRVEEKYESLKNPVQEELPDASEIVIENFTRGLEQGKGGIIVVEAVERWVNDPNFGTKAVAECIERMSQDGVVVTVEVFYQPEKAMQFVAEMFEYLRKIKAISDSEIIKIEDAIQEDIESFIPEELQ